jgi:xanthine dehydrogenase accessory factor
MMFDEFLSKASALRSAGSPFALAVVVAYEPPVSGKPGDKAIIHADGSVWGWIGGGCSQPLVVREALKALRDGRPRLVRIAPSDNSATVAGVVNYTMTCHSGGALEVYIEPVLPKPQVLVFGRSLVARTLCKLARTVGYTITVVAPGADHEALPDADLITEQFDLNQVKITPETYIVVSTQGESDEEALEQALRTGASYVAFVASPVKARKILDHLGERGLPADLLSRARSPAGLDLGAVSPQEIAVSILAEIVKVRRTQAIPVQEGKEEAMISEASNAEATDPICKMTVEVAAAKYKSEYGGTTYYFCCAGCKQKFDQEPAKYAVAQS